MVSAGQGSAFPLDQGQYLENVLIEFLCECTDGKLPESQDWIDFQFLIRRVRCDLGREGHPGLPKRGL